ncbi:hypothetical protein ACLESO_50085, partial [Pyxidicoccus sp. 3LG]
AASALLAGPQLALALLDGRAQRLVLSARWLPLLDGELGTWGAAVEGGLGPLLLGAELLHGQAASGEGWTAALSVGYRIHF